MASAADIVERSRVLFRAEKWLQIHAGKHPAIFFPLYVATRGETLQIVRPHTEILIEGFPRSANSFAVVAFNHAQGGGADISNNLHVPAQIMRAAKWSIPTLVLLRNPRAAVLSYAVRDPISVERALKHYVSFYESIEVHKDSFVLGLFDEVTSDYGSVIERVNEKFGTNFAPFRHTEENVAEVFRFIDEVYERDFDGGTSFEDAVSRPSESRGKAKERVRSELETPRAKKLLDRAEAVYERLAGSGSRKE
ncbi:MAG: hypothetical protein M3494_08375 [Actinomycetota bacterium]|jgi:hypothetical protein|nr:hypothetical protein [Rubrobacter sp.]MDQ3508013.1 hypothetical protein [Actinomycetota bacterium]